MLSSSKQTTASSAQQQRQRLHRRQNSTPALEAGHLPPLPAIVQRQRSHRRGRSMDQKPTYLNAGPPSPTGTINTANGKTVSITNTGHNDLQHPMQIAQQHGLHQPGPQLSPGFPFRDQGFSFPPRSPPILEETSDNRLPSPQRQPSELDIKNLEQHVKALYGENHTVVVNILPSPTPSPRKPNQTRPLASVDHAPMPPPQFSSDLGSDLQLDPLIMSPQSRNFRFQTPEHEFKYDSYESPDQLSPQQSPTYSPMQTPCKSAFSDKGFNGPKLTFPEGSAVLPTTQAMNSLTLSSPISPTFDSPDITMQSNPGMDPMTPEVEIPPDVQAQIEALVSEPDPTTSQRRCLFPGCTKDPFNRKENALSHVQGHLKWRPYVCNVCNKDFVRPHDLKRHVKIHSDHKPHVCPCGLAFTRADALSRHRSRAVCVGSYPGAVRSQNKRGRPKKRPGIESRVEKANKTRRAIASKGDQSSTSGYSPVSSGPASPGAEDCSQQSSSPASKNAQLHSQAGRFAPVADTAQFASAEQPTFMTSADLTRSESQFSQLSHYSQYSNYSSQPQQQQQQQASQEADRAEEAKWKVQLQMWDSQGSAGFSPETFMTTSSNFHAALQPDIAGSPSDEIFS
ncbi:hypothetical protein BDY21DRAFT_74480 [Lineolata rhizophorae]|uniref:C2H2-type domain-containing protein n=1 Tax=Lineolata rhizophorae TaxID=578093 RepID=A0A6A6NV59_9PEZI|nr:hypothetical protein BDY21DRAFT_74480 [Lineolata rhizophorae]